MAKNLILRKLSTDPDSSYIVIGEVSGTDSTFTDTTAVEGSDYTYKIRASEDSIAVNINISSINQAPTANAGSDSSVTLPASSIQLTGSGVDNDGTIASYSWTQEVGPNAATFSSTTVSNPTVSGLIEGTYTFRLTVTDNEGATGTDTIIISVVNEVASSETALTFTGNKIVEESAGVWSTTETQYIEVVGISPTTMSANEESRIVFQRLNGNSYGYKLGLDPLNTLTSSSDLNYGIKVDVNSFDKIINGTTSWQDDSATGDYISLHKLADGTITIEESSDNSTWNIRYTFATKNTNALYIYFIPLGQGNTTYGKFYNPKFIGNIGASNSLPTANAGTDQTIEEGSTLTLSGSGTDSDGTIVSYAWSIVSGPAVTITNANSATATVSAIPDGNYVFRLTITDDAGDSSTDDVSITVTVIDTANPTTPTVTETSRSGTTITVSITDSTDDVGVTGYNVRLDGGTTIDAGNDGSHTFSGLTAETTYSIEAQAYDASGKVSTWSAPVNITTTVASSYQRLTDVTYTSTTSTYNNKSVGGMLYLCQDFLANPSADIPTLLWFHGLGERSAGAVYSFTDLCSGAGYPVYLRDIGDKPFNIIALQLPSGSVAWPADFINEGVTKMKEVVPELKTDTFAISGYSNGGAGLNYIETNPTKVFASIAFACGVGGVGTQAEADTIYATNPNIGFWFFHNNDDTVIGPGESGASYNLFNAAGYVNAKRSVYATGGHNPITKTLNDTGSPMVDEWTDPYPPINGDPLLDQWILNAYGVEDLSAPTVSSLTVEDATPSQLDVVFSEVVTGVAIADFAVSGNTITAISGSGIIYTFTLGTAVVNGDTPTLSYSGTAVVDGNNNSLATFSGMSITNNVLANADPVANAGVDQTITEGDVLTLSGSGTDSDGTIVSYAWSIVSGTGATIDTPSEATTTVTGATAANSPYTFRVTVTDNEGAIHTDDVVVTVNVAAVAPSNNTIPVISGTTTEGQTLTVSDGTWSGSTPITYAYQWERNGTIISGATSNTYVLTASDVNNTISCVVTATNSAGSANAESAATATIAAASVSNNATYSSLTNITNSSGELTKTGGSNETWDAFADVTEVFNSLLSFHDTIPNIGATTNGYSVMLYTGDTPPTNYTNAPFTIFCNGVGFYAWKDGSNVGSIEQGINKHARYIMEGGSLKAEWSTDGTSWTQIHDFGAVTTPLKVRVSAARLNANAGNDYKIE